LVKIADVARHADVSPGTESHVLNGKRSIRATRRQVLESISRTPSGAGQPIE
jgi:DNA-binding LacI/PurR family transcriptional regulator